MNDLSENQKKQVWPWTRLLARYVDLHIFTLIFLLPIDLIFKRHHTHHAHLQNYVHSTPSNVGSIVLTLMILITLGIGIAIVLSIYMFIDAAICKKFGRNLGHKIFGLQITNQTGHNLTYKDYLKRSFLVCSFHFLSFFYISTLIYYINYKKNGTTYWDRLSKMAVTSKNASRMRTGLSISLYLNFFIVTEIIIIFVMILLKLPKIIH